MVFEHDPVVAAYEHDKSKPREAEALQTLRKVASLVKPVMRQRGWRVGVLTEFYPSEKNLLGTNWNKGQKICLRLRYPYDERQFLPLEGVVDTMLHELCHIVHGPHNEAFHNLWNQLRDEHESLIRKGYTGEGFLSTGHKLGGARIPMQEARRRARAAAERRKALSAGSGQKLGGTPVSRGQDIRIVIADAATRRATVTKGCASGTDRGRGIAEETTKSSFRTKAEEDDANEEAIMLAFIDLVQEEEKEKYGDAYVPPSKENPAGSQGIIKFEASQPSVTLQPRSPVLRKPPLMEALRAGRPTLPSQAQLSQTQVSSLIDLTITDETSATGSWTCDICTLSNTSNYLVCDACGTERPESNVKAQPPPRKPIPWTQPKNNKKPASKALETLRTLQANEKPKPLGWLCHRCGTFMESEWWTCSSCGTMKQSS